MTARVEHVRGTVVIGLRYRRTRVVPATRPLATVPAAAVGSIQGVANDTIQDGAAGAYGANAWLVEEMYEAYLADPKLVPHEIVEDGPVLENVLMGDDVELRRHFIQTNAKDVRFLDI